MNIFANRSSTQSAIFLVGMFATVAIAACAPQVDLQAVQKYAEATADASASFSTVAAGYATSCTRLAELSLPAKQLTQTNIQPVTSFLFSASPAPTTPPTPSTAVSAATVCDVALAQSVSADWDKHNQIVLGYVQALGAVAGVDVEPSFAPVGNALVQAKLISDTQNTAFTDLANRITGIVIAGQQREEIAQLVTTVNDPLKTAIGALKQVAGNYTGVLTAEFNATYAYYNRLIVYECGRAMHPPRQVVDCSSAPISPALRDRIHRQRDRLNTQLTDINTSLTKANDYSKVLTDIQTTHEKLYDAAQRKPDMQDYVKILQQDVLPLYKDVEQLKGGS